MSAWGILTLAVGLAMDAMAAAAARGLAAREVPWRAVVRIGVLFGGFQAAMPALGLLVGHAIGPFVAAWDHWLIFAVLVVLGVKMLREANEPKGETDTSLELRPLLGLAVATSLDALAVGVTLPMMQAPIAPTLVTIGVVTAVLSGLALRLGAQLGARAGSRLDRIGGVVLIGLGLKILTEHLLLGR